MTQEKDYSDSILNAFIDGELDDREKNELIADMKLDQQLKARVLRLRGTRELVKNAYKNIPIPDWSQQYEYNSRVLKINRYIASVVLVMGIIVGWGAQAFFNQSNTLLEFAEISEQNNLINNNGETARVMIHVTTDDTARLKVVLDETENLLKQYEESRKKLEISILTNARGINFISASTPFAERLHSLAVRYRNVSFKACKETLDRFNKEEIRNIQLLPEAQVVPSALGEVIKSRQKGWSYIKI